MNEGMKKGERDEKRKERWEKGLKGTRVRLRNAGGEGRLRAERAEREGQGEKKLRAGRAGGRMS